MLTVRCFRCGTRFTLSVAALEEALAATVDSNQKSYPVECLKCRQIIKVPVKELRRFRPRVAPADQPAADQPAADQTVADQPASAPEAEPPARPTPAARGKRAAQKTPRPKAPRA